MAMIGNILDFSLFYMIITKVLKCIQIAFLFLYLQLGKCYVENNLILLVKCHFSDVVNTMNKPILDPFVMVLTEIQRLFIQETMQPMSICQPHLIA